MSPSLIFRQNRLSFAFCRHSAPNQSFCQSFFFLFSSFCGFVQFILIVFSGYALSLLLFFAVYFKKSSFLSSAFPLVHHFWARIRGIIYKKEEKNENRFSPPSRFARSYRFLPGPRGTGLSHTVWPFSSSSRSSRPSRSPASRAIRTLTRLVSSSVIIIWGR